MFEILKLEIRGQTIAYSSHRKKQLKSKEEELEKEINILQEKLETELTDPNIEILMENKITEMNKIRETKIRGIMLRSKVQWYEMGEKPTKYFCNIEKRNYVRKLITKLDVQGNIVYKFIDILHEQKKFYENLYSLNNPCVSNIQTMRNSFLKEENIKPLTDEQIEICETDIVEN